MKKKLLILILLSVVSISLWGIINKDCWKPNDGIVTVWREYLSDDGEVSWVGFYVEGDKESTWQLPVGTEPNDFTFRAKDVNRILKIIDCNGVEYRINPKPLNNTLVFEE